VIVPSAFIVIEPAAGVGAAPGVNVTFPPPPTVAAPPFSVSLPRTDTVDPPLAPLTGEAEKSSFDALIDPAETTTVAVAEAQFDPFNCSQIV
jgi:hypothetical protein